VNGEVKRSSFDPDWCFILDNLEEAKQNHKHMDLEVVFNFNLDSYAKQNKVIVDRMLLVQVLDNLISNSVDEFVEAKVAVPNINVMVKMNDGKLEIHYCDNGRGITSNLKEVIFEPFYSTKEMGSGIGLALVRSLLEGMQGTIKYMVNEKSSLQKNCDCHCCFDIFLPVSSQLDAAIIEEDILEV